MNSVALVDERPFFVRALCYGLEHGLLIQDNLNRMLMDAPKGIVQIADHFGSAYLTTDLESAIVRLTHLMSLYLEDLSKGDLHIAALSLRDNTLLSHSRGGSEMLKRLHALPTDTSLLPRKIDASQQKAFVNERSFAFPLSAIDYNELFRQYQANQTQIDFARWLAKCMNTNSDDYENFSAEEVIRSAMLVLYVCPKILELPSKSQFVLLLETLRKKSFKPQERSLTNFLLHAPETFSLLCQQAMNDFISRDLPTLRSQEKSADQILHSDAQGCFFVREAPEEEIATYDKLVAREWVRITRGNADDPGVLASIFLSIATGHPAKANLLLKDAKSIIDRFRKGGFDSEAVIRFIEQNAPFEQREDLGVMWLQDLKPDAEIHLADSDPQMPDQFMDRALKYVKINCACSWKGRNN